MREVGETFTVELVLKMLESECIVKNISWILLKIVLEYYVIRYGDLPSVIAVARLSMRGAAVTMPAAVDRAMIDWENFILA